MNKANIAEKFKKIKDNWDPKIAGELNGQQVRLAKFKGEFTFHKHEEEDEMFLVHKGSIQIHLQDHAVQLHEGEFMIIPRGQMHKPSAVEEAHVILFTKASGVNTGDTKNEMTKENLDRI